MTTSADPDGRYTATHIARYYVCGHCWQPLVVKHIADRWQAVCGTDDRHIGFHDARAVERVKQQSSFDYLEFVSFYRETEFASSFGLKSREAWADILKRNKRALGRDECYLF